ncbi:MAG: AAA family ATPase [Desulfobacteraceae bacterium]|nr:AAA family ATPase [Desulfobacteraceae bacterium]
MKQKQKPYDHRYPARSSVFVGREEITSQLTRELKNPGTCFGITGGPGMGKTSLLLKVKQQLAKTNENNEPGPIPIPVYVDCKRDESKAEDILSDIVNSMAQEFSEQCSLSCPDEVINKASRGHQLKDRLKPVLDWAYNQNRRTHLPIVLTDNLHRICGHPIAGSLASLLNPVVDSKDISLVLAGEHAFNEELRKDISPLRALIAGHYDLKPFNLQETEELIEKVSQYGWKCKDECAVSAHKMTNGHPFRLHYYLYNTLSRKGELSKKGLKNLYTRDTEQFLDSILSSDKPSEMSCLSKKEVDIIRRLIGENDLEKAIDMLWNINLNFASKDN